MLLKPREPFNFAQTLRFILYPPALLNGRQFTPLLDYFENGEFRRAAEINGEPVLYSVTEVRRIPIQLRVRILAGPSDAHTKRAVCRLVERQFSTALDLTAFAQVCARDAVLARL